MVWLRHLHGNLSLKYVISIFNASCVLDACINKFEFDHPVRILNRVLRRLEFFVRSCPAPAGIRNILPASASLPHSSNPHPSHSALFPSQTRTWHCVSENYEKLMQRVSSLMQFIQWFISKANRSS